MPFDGLRVLSFESRRAPEIEILIRKQGGQPFVAPAVRERAKDEHSEAFDFAARLEAGEFDMVICLTGVGLKFLSQVIESRVPLENLIAALSRVTTVVRGPKPAAVLRQWGVPIGLSIPEPNTWREIVAAVAERPERVIALLEYGRPNTDLIAVLDVPGRTIASFSIYQWDLPEDLMPLEEAVRRIARGECDVALFTSSIQIEHLLRIAERLNLNGEVLAALQSDIVVASIGPIMSGALEANGIHPAIVPEHPKMGMLVKAAADGSASVRGRLAPPAR